MTNRPERRPRNAATLRSFLSFQFPFQALALWQSQVQHWWSASPRVPPRGSLSISTAPLFSLSLSLPLQVSFCWKSLGCWKPRKWRRKRRAWTPASLMWCSARPTCSGELLLLLKPDDSAGCSAGSHQAYFIFLWQTRTPLSFQAELEPGAIRETSSPPQPV